jgi:hypothetical protein
MSTAPNPTPAPHRRLQRPHLRLVGPSTHEAAAPSHVRHGHAPHTRIPYVTLFDAVAIFATLYVAVILIRFVGW